MNFLEARLVPEDGGLAVDIQGTRLTLPPDKAKSAEAYTNKNVVFGIRPEDILATPEKTSAHLTPLRTTVEVLEPLGAEIVLELSYQGYTFTARMDPQMRARMHDEIEVYFDMERVHLFDPQTEQVIF
jgi:multiple sugar transport system ATP-binding protein